MQTRKTNRKTITLAGQYFAGLGAPVDVTITDLSPRGCRFATSSRNLARGTRLQIYLEGSGPHAAMLKWIENGEVGVTFVTPLTDELFRKFQNTHVPIPGANREAREYLATPRGAPNRFC